MKQIALSLFLLVLSVCASAQGPTVYINGDQGMSASGSGFALGKVAVSGASVGKNDKTSEMAYVLLDTCPEVSLTVDDAHSDYLLLLSHQPGYYSGVGRIMVLRPDKSVMFASKQSRLSKVMKDGCKAIMADWKDRRPHTAQTADPKANWNIIVPVASASEPPARQP